MSDIANRLDAIRATLPDGVALVAVSKYHPEQNIMEAYERGQRAFGESHERELTRKQAALPKDIEWHFIGHLQTNKVRHIVPYVAMVEAVDSLRLLREIQRQAERHGRVVDVLLELHIAAEDTKFGLTLDECRQLLDEGEWRQMHNVRICGLMMMASNVDDEAQVRREMTIAADFFDEVKARYFADAPHFKVRSWGMSDDYLIACQCRSTMVRVGSAIFGPRVY